MKLMLKKPTASNQINNVDINFLMRPNSLTTFSNVIAEIDLKLFSIYWNHCKRFYRQMTIAEAWKIIVIFTWFIMVVIVEQITLIHIHNKCSRNRFDRQKRKPKPKQKQKQKQTLHNKIMQSQHYYVEKQIQFRLSKSVYCQHLHFVNGIAFADIEIGNHLVIEAYAINHLNFANSPSTTIIFKIEFEFEFECGCECECGYKLKRMLFNANSTKTKSHKSQWNFSSVIKLLFIFLVLCSTTSFKQFIGAIKNDEQENRNRNWNRKQKEKRKQTQQMPAPTQTQNHDRNRNRNRNRNEHKTERSSTKPKSITSCSQTTTPTTTTATQQLSITNPNLMNKMCRKLCTQTETHIRNLLNVATSIRIRIRSRSRRRRRKTSSQLLLLKNHLSFLVITFLMCSQFCAIKASAHNMKYSSNVVKTKYGELRGIIVRNNPTVEAYLGIPYATPPIGSLRYMPPVTPSAWKSTRIADRFSPVCPQLPPVSPTGREELLDVPRERLAQIRRLLPLLANQSEDCLYLNLYVPRTDEFAIKKGDRALATIVYIHGESFEWNSGNPYDGSILAAHGNVIVVTINFRLGVLGFLKTGAKGSAQGNFGLMDLVAGLHWLRENLPAFNGDPSKLILMGHGTGASLANMLLISPVASDLIRRAILLSGSSLSPWAIQSNPLYVKRKVAEHTGCHGDLVEDDLAPCLRTKSLTDLLSTSLEMPRFLPGFAPFVDGSVIVGHSSLSNDSMNLPIGSAVSSSTGMEMTDLLKRQILFGVTSLESYLDLSAQDLEFGFNETRRDRILRTYVRNNFNYHLNEIYAALKNEYTDWERPPRNPLGSRDAALELLSDGHTVAPLIRVGYLHSLRGGVSYFMHFKHQSSERDFPQRTGSVRGEDVPFCFGLPISPLFPHNYTKQDIKISRIMVQYIANFAHTGNPNETPSTYSHISQTKHNHIASPMEINKLNKLATDTEVSLKQKRQMIRNVSMRRRNKRNRNYYNNNEDSDESDERDMDYDGRDSDEENDRRSKDRLNETPDQHCPFWDAYDSLNQYYIEIGNKVEMKNHYRGHKLSLWLNLIPQLHMPGDLNELSMRHHHFSESDAKFYDGAVREQIIEKPKPIKPVVTKIVQSVTPTKAPIISTTPTTTECPTNTTLPTLAATKPQQNLANKGNKVLENKGFNNMEGFLRHLTNNQFQSYSAALAITIGVGCFLLLLNILIFAAIYYQRVKRTLDAKRKEEFVETDMQMPHFIEQCMDKANGKNLINMSELSAKGQMDYTEYNRYSGQLEKSNLFANVCNVEHKCKSVGNDAHIEFMRPVSYPMNMGDTPEKSRRNSRNSQLLFHPTQYASTHVPSAMSGMSDAGSSNSSDLVTYQYHQQNCREYREQQKIKAEQCNQSTQADDFGAAIIESDADERPNNKIDENCHQHQNEKVSSTPSSLRSSISTTNYQGGILRQQPPTTPSATKKRVQIREISV